MRVPPRHLVPHLQKWVTVNAIKLWWIEQEPACLSFSAKQRPKPTATGETWQSCRPGKERVLSWLLMIMVVAGVQTDTAELVCTVRGHRSIHAHREKRDQGVENRYYCQRLSVRHWVILYPHFSTQVGDEIGSFKKLLIAFKASPSFGSWYKAFSDILHLNRLIDQKRKIFLSEFAFY